MIALPSVFKTNFSTLEWERGMGKPKEQKVYMPLMVGDWLKGTSGMRAEVKGVYINLLLHQWDHGHIPEDIDELVLIAPEVAKVWDKLKAKFPKISPGKLQNKKLEDVREFWKKQKNNGKKGGRPKKENPKHNPEGNPNTNPNDNPKHNHHNDLDIDSDLDLKIKESFDEIYLNQEAMKWSHLDFNFEFNTFVNKVRGSPADYMNRDSNSLKLAFQYQLRNSKGKKNGHHKKQSPADLAEALAIRMAKDAGIGQP